MARVLLFTDWFYPGFMAGGTIRSAYNLVDALKNRHEFSIVTRNTDYTSARPYESVQSDAWNLLPNGMRVFYGSRSGLAYGALSGLIGREQFDVAYFNGLYSPRLTLMPLLITERRAKKTVLAPRGMAAPSSIAVKSWKKRPFLFWLKNSRLIGATRFHASSELEAGHIRKIFGGGADIKIAPDLPGKAMGSSVLREEKRPGSLRLISVARISPEKNLLFALQVLRRVRAQVRFDVFGPVYDSSYWKKCLALIGRLPGNIDCRYRGVLAPEQVAARLGESHFLFLASRGESFGHAIMESLACGVPVLISDQTPWRDLLADKSGRDIRLDNPAEFTRFIEQAAAMDAASYAAWTRGALGRARAFAEDPHLVERSRALFE